MLIEQPLYYFPLSCRDVVITIISDETQDMDAMRVCVSKPACKDPAYITTPMRMLIEEMPGQKLLLDL